MNIDPSSNPCDSQLELVVVAQEGRIREMAGLKLLLASLYRYSPSIPILAFIPSNRVEALSVSLNTLNPNTKTIAFDTSQGWGCKPTVLLQALDRFDAQDIRVLWIDSDILINQSISNLANISQDKIIVGEETNPHENSQITRRQELLSLSAGRSRVTTLSSCIVGVTRQHRRILDCWQRLVGSAIFSEQQSLPWGKRLLPGDQEVLEAILCSPQFENAPLYILRNWKELLQGTYSPNSPPNRSQSMRSALFVHATGNLKPWRQSKLRLAQEMFPYFDLAQSYLSLLDPSERGDFHSQSPASRFWKQVGVDFYHYAYARQLLTYAQIMIKNFKRSKV